MGIIWMGPAYITLLIVACQYRVFRELVSVRYTKYTNEKREWSSAQAAVTSEPSSRLSRSSKSNHPCYHTGTTEGNKVDIPMFRTLQWGWFLVAMFYYYGNFAQIFSVRPPHVFPTLLDKILIEPNVLLSVRVIVRLLIQSVHLKASRPAMQWLASIMHLHTFVAFMGFSVCFVLSILSLRPDAIKYQMGHLVWTVCVIALVCAQMSRTAAMVHEGIFWFFFPAWLVINNDCWAYFWGMAFGKKIIKRNFLAISPNKTWEGFFGALVCTTIVAFFSADWFSDSQLLTCPSMELTLMPHPDLSCDTPPVFVKTNVKLPVLQMLPVRVLHSFFSVRT